MADDVATNLAHNLRLLREGRGLTQQQCAARAGVPRPTWSTLESGSANPTLSVLVKVATALQVTIPELIGRPRSGAHLVPAREIPVKRRGGAALRHLLPEPLAGLELDRLELDAGGTMVGVPHTPGTREYLTCERGQVELVASGDHFRLAPGDVVIFRGDQRHSYHNPGRTVAVAYSVVALRPA